MMKERKTLTDKEFKELLTRGGTTIKTRGKEYLCPVCGIMPPDAEICACGFDATKED